MPKLIKDWDELAKCESETHYIEMHEMGYSAWIHPKVPGDDKDWFNENHYLSTHTFYGSTYEYYTKVLQECGFDVQLDNWDKEESK